VASPAAPTAASSAAAAPPTTGQPRRTGRARGARRRHETARAGRPGAPPPTREAPWAGARGPKRPKKREGGATSDAARASMPRLDVAPPIAAAQQHDLWRGLAGALRRAPHWFDDWQKKDVHYFYFYSASSNKTETNSIQSPLDAIQLEISRPDVLSRVSRTMPTVIGLNSLSSHFAKHEPNHVPCQARSRHLPLAFLFPVLVSWEMLRLLGPVLSSFGADSCTGVPWSVHQAREHQPLPITNVRSLGQ